MQGYCHIATGWYELIKILIKVVAIEVIELFVTLHDPWTRSLFKVPTPPYI